MSISDTETPHVSLAGRNPAGAASPIPAAPAAGALRARIMAASRTHAREGGRETTFFGEPVVVVGLTVAQRSAIGSTAKKTADSDVVLAELYPALLIAGLRNPGDLSPIFPGGDEDVVAIREMDGAEVERVATIVMEASGMTREAQREIKGKSDAGDAG